jgi:cell division protein FtsB
MTSKRWCLMTLGLIVGFSFFQYRLWFEAGGIIDMHKLKRALIQQQAANEKLKQRNEELIFQIARSQHSQDSAEARARNELGMIKKGETFYQIVH